MQKRDCLDHFIEFAQKYCNNTIAQSFLPEFVQEITSVP